MPRASGNVTFRNNQFAGNLSSLVWIAYLGREPSLVFKRWPAEVNLFFMRYKS